MKKSCIDIPSNGIQAPIEPGQKVVFVDGSYTVAIRNGEYVIDPSYYPGTSQDIWTVVAVNVTCPTKESSTGSLSYQNNCIVKNDVGDIVFCSKINIINIRHVGEPEPRFKSLVNN